MSEEVKSRIVLVLFFSFWAFVIGMVVGERQNFTRVAIYRGEEYLGYCEIGDGRLNQTVDCYVSPNKIEDQ